MLPEGASPRYKRAMSRAPSTWVLLASALALCSIGCREPVAARGLDGGAFVLPDAGFRDASAPDPGDVDAGPFVCEPACEGAEVCACRGADCGCGAPGVAGDRCDPQVPASCAAPSACVRTRQRGQDVFECTVGGEGSACSKTDDRCVTALGCVCLTPLDGRTTCTCRQTWDPAERLCDRMVPETCPGGTCVRVVGPQGTAGFSCSDGSRGQPCEPEVPSCRTSLGCTCPVFAGRQACLCSEPGEQAGEPCDPRVAGSCAPPLSCRPTPGEGGLSSTCQGEPGPSDAGAGRCDPRDPRTCPRGFVCVDLGGGLECVPDR